VRQGKPQAGFRQNLIALRHLPQYLSLFSLRLSDYAVGTMLIFAAATTIGFVAFLYAGVFILGSLFSDLHYEAALPYLLGIALLGSVFSGWIAIRFCRKKSSSK
jgi:hypothetical protein